MQGSQIFDIGVVALCVLSGILAMYRGLVRELLSIVSWLVAGGAAAYVALSRTEWATAIVSKIGINNEKVGQGILGVAVFLIVLVVVHLITIHISDVVLDSQIGLVDRVLGLIFGVIRAFLIVLIPYMLYVFLYPAPEQQMSWVRDAVATKVVIRPANDIFSPTLKPLADWVQNRFNESKTATPDPPATATPPGATPPASKK